MLDQFFSSNVKWCALAIIVIFFFYIFIQLTARSPRDENLGSEVHVSEVMKNANNGDLLLFSGTTLGERTCRWFTGSGFSHIGMLFWEDSTLYITESDVGQGSKNGPRVMKLEDKLKRCQKNTESEVLWLRCRYTIDTSSILQALPKYMDQDFDSYMLSWFYSPLKVKGKMFCSEYITSLLSDLGILDRSEVAVYTSPESYLSRYSSKYYPPLHFLT